MTNFLDGISNERRITLDITNGKVSLGALEAYVRLLRRLDYGPDMMLTINHHQILLSNQMTITNRDDDNARS